MGKETLAVLLRYPMYYIMMKFSEWHCIHAEKRRNFFGCMQLVEYFLGHEWKGK